MNEHRTHITELFHKYLNGDYTDQELQQLLDYFGPDKHADQLRDLIMREFDQPVPVEIDKMLVKTIARQVDGHVQKSIHPDEGARRIRPYYVWATAIAALLIMVVGFSIYSGIWKSSSPAPIAQQTEDIGPGGNRATLRFSNGNSIPLNENKDGIVAGKEQYAYTDGETVSVTLKDIDYATLSTPRGGQYQITLPDGSKVWLNAASSLRYPTRFTGKERTVELKGEGYFDITTDEKHPFIVRTQAQEIKVLGTEFNITAYGDEQTTSTTLVEGSVSISHTGEAGITIIKPGQQAILKDNRLTVAEVSVQDYTAWKDGFLVLNNADLPTIARQVERWYDVEFIMKPEQTGSTLSGILPRDVNLSEVLTGLEFHTGLRFQLEGRRIMVSK
ncbi:FecR family protein [Parapedobacter sp. 10938]|uniref:FecR family protein n=1 Tax=Parapedobacter flavus TaxID=3110225 RepID=UPI002DBD115B|nr:FecR domain-containing protein [Parapedobacter sp. 10938]MEC3880215.1 FecR domain-containing protein [Parapedobacter sp. 10938]